MAIKTAAKKPKRNQIPSRDRILTTASELFYRDGIRGVGLEAVAAGAMTNKASIYRHFNSRDELITEWLRSLMKQTLDFWSQIEASAPDNPGKQLDLWLNAMIMTMSQTGSRGCPFANTAVELPDFNHPARSVIADYKAAQREHLARLCRKMNLIDPDIIGDGIFFILEGGQVMAQAMEPTQVAERVKRAVTALLAQANG